MGMSAAHCQGIVREMSGNFRVSGEWSAWKAFSVSAASVWNSLSYSCTSAKLLSTFKRSLKTELFVISYRKREHSA